MLKPYSVISLCEACKTPFHMLDAIKEVSERETNVLEKMKAIPIESGALWRDGIDTDAYDEAVLEDVYYEDEVRAYLVSAVYPYFVKGMKSIVVNEHDELMDMRYLANLVPLVEELLLKALHNYSIFGNCNHNEKKINYLLEITDAMLKKAEQYWRKWRYKAEEIANNTPLDEILGYLHEQGFTGIDEVLKRLLPDAVASLLFHVHSEDVFLYQLEEKYLGYEKDALSNRVQSEILECLAKGYLYRDDMPVEDQLTSIYDNMMMINFECAFDASKHYED